MNNLGGMIFVVSGIALGYWVVTGHATQFLQAVQGKSPQQQAQNPLQQWFTNPQNPLLQQIPNTGAQTLQQWWSNIWNALNQQVPKAPWIQQQQPYNPSDIHTANIYYDPMIMTPSDMIAQNQPEQMYYG